GVYTPLCNAGHTVHLIAITLEGRWFLQKTQEISHAIQTDYPLSVVPGEGLFCAGKILSLDVAFAVTHGFGGEDGNLQGLCLLANLPLCGCDTLSSAIGMHKDIASKLFALEGIPTVPSLVLHAQDILWLQGKSETPPSWIPLQGDKTKLTPNNETTRRWSEASLILQKKVGPSLFVKPEDSGSSLGVFALRSPDGPLLKQAILEAKRHSSSVLVQTLIEPMDELECAVLDSEDGSLIVAGPALVVDPGKQSNHFLSYEYKYSQVDSAYLKIPSSYEQKVEEKVRHYARQAFRAIGGEGYARIDFFVSGDKIYLNEINTSPGMTNKSHFPLLMGHAGYSMEQVLQILIDHALRRKKEELLRTYRPPGA
ncbi:MAG TPA: D-alanine--D-alanine ligase, partial [Sphaerochaeta sp.]|nr:D-alanine--D-alanine ligase [Sphaerochaeta sp.]